MAGGHRQSSNVLFSFKSFIPSWINGEITTSIVDRLIPIQRSLLPLWHIKLYSLSYFIVLTVISPFILTLQIVCFSQNH